MTNRPNIAFAGLTAAGKTTHAKILAHELDYEYVSATKIILDMRDLIAKKSEHADYFKELIRQFDHYQKVFEKIFNEPNQAKRTKNMVYDFLVQYKGMGGGGKKILAMRVLYLLVFCDIVRILCWP